MLESLLKEFPKAVLLKDKRDRVPLEHGRDLKFSSKMMRIYAEAYVDAVGAAGSDRDLRHSSPRHSDKLLGHKGTHRDSPRNNTEIASGMSALE